MYVTMIINGYDTYPNELGASTPGYFVIGSPITALPNPDLSRVSSHRLKHSISGA